MFKKLLRTMGSYKAQFISMILMVAVGFGIFLGFNTEWYTLYKNVGSFQSETNLSDYQIISEAGFTREDLQKIKNIEGVEDCGRYLSIKTEVDEIKNSTMALTVTENPDVSGFIVTSGQKYDAENPDGIWLSDKYAAVHKIKIGDTLTFIYKGMEIKGKVAGLIKSGEYTVCISGKEQILPDFKTHGFAYISPEMLKSVFKAEYYSQINVISESDKKTFANEADKALGKTVLTVSKDENISYAGPKGEIDEGKTMGMILPALFLLIAVLTMVTTMQRLTAKEKIQIGTFKSLGFKDRKISAHYTSYSLIVGIIGSAIGIVIGVLFAFMILNPDGDMMACYIDMPDWSLKIPAFCYITMVGVVLILMLIGYLSVRKMLKGTAADALRPYSPKKMKPMLIENTAFFHKLSFGTRWNMRDTARHKSRTFMSLLGTLGCMVIILSCLGMFDTLDLFVERYYGGSLNYNSRIYITDTDKEAADEIIKKYPGDVSSSLSVKLDDAAVSLDIYRLNNDKIRFLDEKMNYTSLGDDGAYICKRIAKDHKLKAGDTVYVKPFGSDGKYEIKIAGIISSYAESISLTEKYAEKANIPFNIDSVYTDVEKSEIKTNSAVGTIQDKQSLTEAFNVMLNTMNVMIYALVSAAIILGTAVLYNLGVMSYTERYREMATLKVVGFKDRAVAKLLIGQNLTVSIIGTILGIPVSLGVLKAVLDTLAPEYELTLNLTPLSYIISIVLTLGITFAVSLMLARKNKKIDMVESLKSGD